jgi:AraC-like DNA-binding protein
MTYRQHDTHEIKPAAPDDVVGGLLALPFSRVLPLSVGDAREGYGDTGEYAVIAAVRGNVTVTTHGRYDLLQPGQALVLHQVGAYTIQSVSDCLCMEAKLTGELADRLLLDRMQNGGALFPRSAAAVREAVMALSVLDDEDQLITGSMASGCAYSLLMKLRDDTAQPWEAPRFPPLVESAIAIIQEEFPFLDGLDELAQRLEISKAHLIRTFNQKTGISPGKYLTRVRVEHAKLLLRDEDASIAYVAEASGFANANYFAKVFRRETGMSPSEWMESTPRTSSTSRRVLQHQG